MPTANMCRKARKHRRFGTVRIIHGWYVAKQKGFVLFGNIPKPSVRTAFRYVVFFGQAGFYARLSVI